MITIALDVNANKAQLMSELSTAGYQSSLRDHCIDINSADYDAVIIICKPYAIRPTTEQQWDSIRDERVRLLTACDWTQLADAPLTDTERVTWQQYRQALRDLPQTYPNPDDVVFPEKP
jgi:hypothetical protein